MKDSHCQFATLLSDMKRKGAPSPRSNILFRIWSSKQKTSFHKLKPSKYERVLHTSLSTNLSNVSSGAGPQGPPQAVAFTRLRSIQLRSTYMLRSRRSLQAFGTFISFTECQRGCLYLNIIRQRVTGRHLFPFSNTF